MKRNKKNGFGMTVLDLILAVLVVAALLSTVFYGQIRSFLQEEKTLKLSYTFRIERVTDAVVNLPVEGDLLYEQSTGELIGTLTEFVQDEVYTFEKPDSGEELQVTFYTFRAQTDAVAENGTPFVSGLSIKEGKEYLVTTSGNASFKMIITAWETAEE